MKEKLNLSPEQVQAIQDIMKRQTEMSSAMMQKMFTGKLTKDEMEKLKQSDNPKASIESLLTPEQKVAYEAFQQEETANNARLAANAEMMQMQNVLGLTQEQQDKVFPILYEQTTKQIKNEVGAQASKDPAEALQARLDSKMKALEGVLTPAQLDGYRQQQEMQIKFVKSIMNQEPGASPAK